MQSYSKPERADDPYALPDIDIFYLDRNEAMTLIENHFWDGRADYIADYSGWYWQACFPGCLPDGDPVGPFDTEEDAITDSQDWE